jgi:competence protein ComEC
LSLVGRPSGFVAEQWLRADGDARSADDGSLRQEAKCDAAGCVVAAAGGRWIAFVQDFSAFEEDCRRAAAIVTRLTAPPTCKASFVLDGDDLKERGAATIRFSPEAVELRSVRKGREVRSWSSAEAHQTGMSPAPERPRRAQPVPEQDFPEEDPQASDEN